MRLKWFARSQLTHRSLCGGGGEWASSILLQLYNQRITGENMWQEEEEEQTPRRWEKERDGAPARENCTHSHKNTSCLYCFLEASLWFDTTSTGSSSRGTSGACVSDPQWRGETLFSWCTSAPKTCMSMDTYYTQCIVDEYKSSRMRRDRSTNTRPTQGTRKKKSRKNEGKKEPTNKVSCVYNLQSASKWWRGE